MAIKHPNLKLACCGLLAAALLPACGGGSSSSGPAPEVPRTFAQGEAAGTAATLGRVLTQLEELHELLTAESDPAPSGRGFSSFARALEPRNRAALAAELQRLIDRVETARDAAAMADADSAEAAAAAAQRLADQALAALRLVVAADTAAGADDETARAAAVAALQRIVAVDPAADDAQQTISNELMTARIAAENRVKTLEADLAAAGGGDADLQRLQRQLMAARDEVDRLAEAQRANDNARTARFGAPPTAGGAPLRLARTTYHPRRSGVTMVFDTSSSTTVDDARVSPGRDARVFNPLGSYRERIEYDVVASGSQVETGPNRFLKPPAVVYDPAGTSRQVFTATSPNTSHFPARGTVFRGALRHILRVDASIRSDGATRSTPVPNEAYTHSRRWLYNAKDRLQVQGDDPEPEPWLKGPSGGTQNLATNALSWNNWDASASVTFQYKTNGGLTMGFGGDGLIFSDLERYTAKTCTTSEPNCNNPTSVNLEISFGQPQADPFGQPATNYWYVQAPSPRLAGSDTATVADPFEPDLASAGNQIDGHDAGRYELILSNNAGVGDNGANRRLKYAAYGLFQFIDFATARERVGRMQTFYYGVEAFKAERGRSATALMDDDVIEGTFRGKTAAWVVTSQTKEDWEGGFTPIANLFRARGDITLNACIGGTDACGFGTPDDMDDDVAASMISGRIDNLEYANQNQPGYWTQNAGGGIWYAQHVFKGTDADNPPYIELVASGIDPDGSYGGTAAPRNMTGDTGLNGTYEGRFYGPAGPGLETAGTWRINMHETQLSMDAIIGSFGAVCTAGDCAPSP